MMALLSFCLFVFPFSLVKSYLETTQIGVYAKRTLIAGSVCVVYVKVRCVGVMATNRIKRQTTIKAEIRREVQREKRCNFKMTRFTAREKQRELERGITLITDST